MATLKITQCNIEPLPLPPAPQDLLRCCAPESHPDRAPLREALDAVSRFLSEYNVTHAGEMFPGQHGGVGGVVGGGRQRHLVKNSFVVELADGARKLRHLFLFNDVLVCAKYKASARRAEKFTFQIKWYIPLWNVSKKEQKQTTLLLFGGGGKGDGE